MREIEIEVRMLVKTTFDDNESTDDTVLECFREDMNTATICETKDLNSYTVTVLELVNKTPYKVHKRLFKTKEIPLSWTHIYGNPFVKDVYGIYEVMNILVDVADRNVLPIEDTYAYSYAMAVFGEDFFPTDIEVTYVYQHKEDYHYGVSKIIWESKWLKGRVTKMISPKKMTHKFKMED